ncbi:MAG: hypothetical protein AAFW74_13650, partial [Pseudomonadota bacterium]
IAQMVAQFPVGNMHEVLGNFAVNHSQQRFWQNFARTSCMFPTGNWATIWAMCWRFDHKVRPEIWRQLIAVKEGPSRPG